MDDAAREYIARARTIGGELAREMLAALNAAEARVAELEEYRDALMEGIGIDPDTVDTYSPLALKGIASVLYAAEARVAELENAARRMFDADGPRNEIAAERELKRLVGR